MISSWRRPRSPATARITSPRKEPGSLGGRPRNHLNNLRPDDGPDAEVAGIVTTDGVRRDGHRQTLTGAIYFERQLASSAWQELDGEGVPRRNGPTVHAEDVVTDAQPSLLCRTASGQAADDGSRAP